MTAEKPPHSRPQVNGPSAPVDPELHPYEPGRQVRGWLRCVQSDTTVELLERWIEGFRRHHPLVRIDTHIGGSRAAGPALTEGWADFAFNARELLPKEETPFRARHGHGPFRVAVAGGSYDVLAFTDAISFFVSRRNPITSLGLTQLDAIYARSPRRGLPRIGTWDQLGVQGEWSGRPIRLYGVRPENGFELFVREHVLEGGDFRDGIELSDTVFPIPNAVAADPCAIGYAGLAFLNEGVRPLGLAVDPAGPPVEATLENVAAQRYPLSRRIFIFAHRMPGQPLQAPLREFVRFALSRDGQQAVADDGIFLPLPAAVAERELTRLLT
jgi:phosphate transport system substrate-binding protein